MKRHKEVSNGRIDFTICPDNLFRLLDEETGQVRDLVISRQDAEDPDRNNWRVTENATYYFKVFFLSTGYIYIRVVIYKN